MKDTKMETTPIIAAQDHLSLSTRLQESLTGRPFDEVLESISQLELSPAELKKHLDEGFLEALSAQEDALMMGEDVDVSARMYADGVSLLAAYQGSKNGKVLIHDGKKERLISVQEYKEQQIVTSLNSAVLNEDDSLIDAIANYSKAAFDLNVIESKSLLSAAGAKLDAALSNAKNNPRVRGVTAAAAVLIATTAASLVTAGPAAADVKGVNFNPTKPSDNEVQKGHAVKVKAKQMQSPAAVPQPETPPKTETVDSTKEKSAQTDEPTASTVTIIENNEEPKKSIVSVSKKGVVSSKNPVIKKADNKDEKKGSVIRIKPIPVTPAPAPEATPAPQNTAPAPEAPAPGVSLEIQTARALAKINHNDLPQHIRDVLPRDTDWNNIAIMLEYMMVNGELTDSQAIGPVANATLESDGLIPARHQRGGPAFGIVQWEGGRRTALEAYAAEKGKPVDDLYVQLDFMLMELKRDAWNGYADLKQAKSSSEATLIFMRKFERPGIPHEDRRVAISNAITEVFNDKLHGFQAASKQATEAKSAADAAAAAAEAEKNAQTTASKHEVEQFSGWKFPVPEGFRITSEFGPRGDALHGGFDLNAGMGVPFMAAAGGKVTVLVSGDVRQQAWCQKALAGVNSSTAAVKDPFQKEVHVTTVIDGVEYVTIYAHMSEVTVAPNQIVKAGELLGKTGNSGCSTGAHAHFEVRRNGVPINPRLLFDGDKWRGAGNISLSSTDISSDDTHAHQHDSTEPGHDHADGSQAHEHATDESVVDEAVVAVQLTQEQAKSPSDSQTPEETLAAMKRVLELKRSLANGEAQSGQSAPADGYLSVQH